MSDDNRFEFEPPHDRPVMPVRLELDNELNFRFHRGVPCWNECCSHADVTLAPYDIICLKQRPGMDPSDSLKKHTAPFRFDHVEARKAAGGQRQRLAYSLPRNP